MDVDNLHRIVVWDILSKIVFTLRRKPLNKLTAHSKNLTIIAAALVAAAILFPCFSWAAEEAAPANAAIVNGKAITYEDFENQLAMFKQQVLRGQTGQLPEALNQRLKEQVIQRMITDELLFQQAVKKGIKIETETIDNEIKRIKGQFQDEQQYREQLKRVGLTEKSIRAQLRQNMTVRQLVKDEIVPQVNVTPEDAKKYFETNKEKFQTPERVKAQHILIKVEDADSKEQKDEARKKLKDLQKRVLAGEDFGTLAKEHSEGPSNVRGGDLGYFTRGKMVKPFEDAAFNLELNEVSDIVETQFGYHLIKVTDHQAAKEATFEEVQPKIMNTLFNEQVQKKLEPYVLALREKASIEVFVK